MTSDLARIRNFERTLEVNSTPGVSTIREGRYLTGDSRRRRKRSENILGDQTVPDLNSEGSQIIIHALDILPITMQAPVNKLVNMVENEDLELTAHPQNGNDRYQVGGLNTLRRE